MSDLMLPPTLAALLAAFGHAALFPLVFFTLGGAGMGVWVLANSALLEAVSDADRPFALGVAALCQAPTALYAVAGGCLLRAGLSVSLSTDNRTISGTTLSREYARAADELDERRFERMSAKGRKLQLLIDGSPSSFALHNISEGGVMGGGVPDLAPGASVQVRFEGGILVPAVVKWAENGLVGLAFAAPVILDRTSQAAN